MFTLTKKIKLGSATKSLMAILLLGAAPLSNAAEQDRSSSELTLQEGFTIDFQTAKVKGLFDGHGVGVNYQTSFGELTKDDSHAKVSIYGRLNYQINQDDHKGNLTHSEVVLGLNWAYSERAHYYAESALMKQDIDFKSRHYSQTFDINRLGVRYNFYKNAVINVAAEHRDGIKNDFGYKVALESTSSKYSLFSLGYQSIGDNQSMFITLISKF